MVNLALWRWSPTVGLPTGNTLDTLKEAVLLKIKN